MANGGCGLANRGRYGRDDLSDRYAAIVVVLWNVVFGLPLLVAAVVMARRRALIAATCLGLYLALLLLLPALYANRIDYGDREPLFNLVGLYFAAWITVAGIVLLPLAFLFRKRRAR